LSQVFTRLCVHNRASSRQKDETYLVVPKVSQTKAICKVLETNTYNDFYLKHEVLYKNLIKELIVISSAMVNEIINTAHQQGHFGICWGGVA